MPICDCLKRVHVTRPAVQLHGHDRLRPGGDSRTRGFGVDHVIRAALDQYRRCTREMYGCRGGNVRVRRNYDLVALTYSGRPECDYQSVSAVGHAKRVTRASERRDRRFEFHEIAL